jgi:phosphate transport system permease protein
VNPDLFKRGLRLRSTLGPILCGVAALIVAAACFFIVGYLIVKGWQVVNWTFLSTDPQPSLLENQAGGIRVPIVGTLILVIISTLLSLPVAVGAAVYLAEYLDEHRAATKSIRLGLEVLAGVPSVVFGMFGIALFSQYFFTFLSSAGAENSRAAFGRSFLVAAIVMAIHVLPFVIKTAEEAIRSVPQGYRSGAAALGIPKWRSLRKVVLPAASPGILTGVILGMGLTAGDTAIVWMTLGGTINFASDQWWQPQNWVEVLRGPGATLTTFIYHASPAGEGNAEALAFGAAAVLVLLVLALNLTAMLVARLNSQSS